MMLINPPCLKCCPSPLPNYIPDPMLTIPPFLRREVPPAGSRSEEVHPENYRAVTPERIEAGVDRIRASDTAEDRRQRDAIRALEVGAKLETKKATSALKREEKKAAKEAHRERKLSQRKVFVKHFKWGIDGL